MRGKASRVVRELIESSSSRTRDRGNGEKDSGTIAQERFIANSLSGFIRVHSAMPKTWTSGEWLQKIEPRIKEGVSTGESKEATLESIELTVLHQPESERKQLMAAAEKAYNEMAISKP